MSVKLLYCGLDGERKTGGEIGEIPRFGVPNRDSLDVGCSTDLAQIPELHVELNISLRSHCVSMVYNIMLVRLKMGDIEGN